MRGIQFCTRVFCSQHGLGYRYYDRHNIAPAFEFGRGLSYTTFHYSALSITSSSPPPSGNGSQFVSFTLTNNGSRVGSEVAQLYLEFPAAADEAPRQLKAYTKVHDLQPGASSKVVFELTPRDFSIWSVERKGWDMVSGVFGVVVGSSSRDHRLRGSVDARP